MLNWRNTQGLVGEGRGAGGGGHGPLRPALDARSQTDMWQGARSAHVPGQPRLRGGEQGGVARAEGWEPGGHGGEQTSEDQGRCGGPAPCSSVLLCCLFSTLSWSLERAPRSLPGTGQEVGFIGTQLSP